jgi:Lhr-like helicase
MARLAKRHLSTSTRGVSRSICSRRAAWHRYLFGRLRAVVVDEIHSFAGDDRGWHLLAVLERLGRLAGRPTLPKR